MVLAFVADEDDAFDASLLRQMEQAIDLPGGEQARFVDDPKFPALLVHFRVFQQARYGAGDYARLSQRLDAAAGRAEAADEVTLFLRQLTDCAHRGGLGGAGAPFDCAQPVASRKRRYGGECLVGR